MENKNENLLTATGFEPLLPSRGYSVPHIVQQFKTVGHSASEPLGLD